MTKFQNIFCLVITLIFVFSCQSKPEGNFVLNGHVKDLKKGIVYLQKEDNKKIIDIDSVIINGNSSFSLTTDIKEPTLLYFKLQKNDGLEHYIPFFADKGVTEINTTLKNFSSDAKIKGSKQQLLLDEYLNLMGDFTNKNLELIKAKFDADMAKDSTASDSLSKRSQHLLRLKYASTINFALRNNNSEVAPYLALYEIPNTSVLFLDSIYNNLTPNIKKSYYGNTLGKILSDFKKKQDSIN